jgi:hypothetical protein
MGLIQEGDFTISYKGKKAIVYHVPTDKKYSFGCFDKKSDNLIQALNDMEKDLMDFKITCPKCNHIFSAKNDDHLWCYKTDEPWVKGMEIEIQCPNCYFEKEY